MYNNQYFQLDIYKEPCHPRCSGLMLLGNTFFWLDDTILISDWFIETYTTLSADEFQQRLPKFLNVDQQVENFKKEARIWKLFLQVTGDPAFSMFNLSLRDEWMNNKKFCHRLSDDEDDDLEATEKASSRLELIIK